MNNAKRIYLIDNMRALLIFLVVFGHLLETVDFPGKKTLYVLIYSFHIPGLCFLSGLCMSGGKNSLRRLFCSIIYPYFVFQTLWIVFEKYILCTDTAWQYHTPIWLIWFLLSMALWYLLSLILPRRGRAAALAAVFSVIAALAAGFLPGIGIEFSLSRTICFFPFFYAGNLCKQYLPCAAALRGNTAIRKILAAGMASTVTAVMLSIPFIYSKWLYYRAPYGEEGGSILSRALFMLAAAVIILFMLIYIPNRNIPVLTYVGRNTMTVFLLHGFAVKYMEFLFDTRSLNTALSVLLCIGGTAALTALLSAKPIVWAFSPLTGLKILRRKTPSDKKVLEYSAAQR